MKAVKTVNTAIVAMNIKANIKSILKNIPGKEIKIFHTVVVLTVKKIKNL